MIKTFALSLCSLLLAATSVYAQFTAHEWGTFTTLCGSDGQRLSGLVREEEWLPNFVYQHDDYHPTFKNKGFGLRDLKNVNVKMETPVIYFYTDKKMDVSVRVDFPRGAISQWYPQRSAGETAPSAGEAVDFTAPYKGWIEWNAEVLSKGEQASYSAPQAEVSNTWSAPRATDASLVRCSSKESPAEVEKYLFYRGVGNFDLPLKTSFTPEGRLRISSSCSYGIPYVLVYHVRDSLLFDKEGKVTGSVKLASVWWSGTISGQGTVEVDRATTYYSGATEALKTEYNTFIHALETAGLYTKEAQAMLNTWYQSYFNHSGLRVFWVLPRPLTDEIIPLTITPSPSQVERVLVGRSEVLTPEFEKMLYESMIVKQDESQWSEDRYLLAYRERMKQMQQTSPVETQATNHHTLNIYPNPIGNSCTVEVRLPSASAVRYQIRNLLGETLLSAHSTLAVEHTQHFELSSLPSGTYYLSVRSADYEWHRVVVK